MELKMIKLTLVLVSSLLIASTCADSYVGVESLKAKLRTRFPGLGASRGAGAAASASAGGGPFGYYPTGGSTATAAAVAASGRRFGGYDEFEPSPAGYRAPPPVRPVVNLDSFRRHNVAYHRTPVPRYPAAANAAASASAAGSAGGFGAASSAAAAGSGAGYGGAVGAANAGTYSNADHGKESSSYRRSTENLLNHEDGHVDDNHYYNAQSYGKTDDENLHEAFNKDDEDIEETPHLFRKKKSGENYVLDYNKARRESGSGVLAKDRHSSAFNKNSRRFLENVDQKHKIRGNGIVENVNHVTAHNFDDDDEEVFDSDGLGAPAGYPASSAAAAAAAAGAA